MKKVTYQKGSIYVTGVDTKHIEIYRFKETVELESEAEVGKHWKDGKEVETAEDNVINNTSPAWIKKPSDLKEEDYTAFYRELYPYSEEPLFHIHLAIYLV